MCVGQHRFRTNLLLKKFLFGDTAPENSVLLVEMTQEGKRLKMPEENSLIESHWDWEEVR